MSNDTMHDARRQVEWANDCKELRLLAKSAEAAVRQEEFEKAHQKLSEIMERSTEISEEYGGVVTPLGSGGSR